MISKRTVHMLVAATSFVVLACGKNVRPPINVLPQDQIFYSDESRLTEVTEMIIRDRDTWWQMWGQITGGQTAPPAVNFENRMLVLVSGGRMNPGDRIQIDRIEPRGEEWVVMYRVIESPGALESDVFPVQVVAVGQRGGQVRFEAQHVRVPGSR